MKPDNNEQKQKERLEQEGRFQKLYVDLMKSPLILDEEKIKIKRLYNFTHFAHKGSKEEVGLVDSKALKGYLEYQSEVDSRDMELLSAENANSRLLIPNIYNQINNIGRFAEAHVVKVKDIRSFIKELQNEEFLKIFQDDKRVEFIKNLTEMEGMLQGLSDESKLMKLSPEEFAKIQSVINKFKQIAPSFNESISSEENQLKFKSKVGDVFTDFSKVIFNIEIIKDETNFPRYESDINKNIKKIAKDAGIEKGSIDELVLMCKKVRAGADDGELGSVIEIIQEAYSRQKNKERVVAGLSDFYGLVNERVAHMRNNKEDIIGYVDSNTNIAPLIHELIKQVKSDGKEVPIDKDYIDRFNRICDVFGAKLQENKNRSNIVFAMQQIIPKMGIKNIADLMADPHKKLIERIIEEPVTTIAADRIVGNKSTNYIQDMKDVRDILVASLKSPVKDKAVSEEVMVKKRRALSITEMENRFKDILSSGKGGLDPEAIAFFKTPGNARKWAKALEVDSKCIGKLGVAGERFSTPEAKQWVQNLINYPLEHQALFGNIRDKGLMTKQALKDGNDMIEEFVGINQRIAQIIIKNSYDNNVDTKELNLRIEKGMTNFANGYNSLFNTVRLKELKDNRNKDLIAQLVARYESAHIRSESVYKKLHNQKIQNATFHDILDIHGKIFNKLTDIGEDRNKVDAAMDAVFKLAEVRGVFYGSAITKDSMNAVINSKEFDKFIVVMNKDPELGKVILDEVKKIGSLSLAQRAEAFNAIHDGMHMTTKGKDDGRIRADIKKVISKSTKGFIFKKLNIEELNPNMRMLQTEDLITDGKASENPSAEKHLGNKDERKIRKENPIVKTLIEDGKKEYDKKTTELGSLSRRSQSSDIGIGSVRR
jgi:hypothetical protein